MYAPAGTLLGKFQTSVIRPGVWLVLIGDRWMLCTDQGMAGLGGQVTENPSRTKRKRNSE